MQRSLLVFGLEASGKYFPLGAHNAQANKKDTEYLAVKHFEYLRLSKELADETYAVVSDGAAAAVAGARAVALDQDLISIVCQSHGLSNFIKDISTKGPFANEISMVVYFLDLRSSAGSFLTEILVQRRAGPTMHSYPLWYICCRCAPITPTSRPSAGCIYP